MASSSTDEIELKLEDPQNQLRASDPKNVLEAKGWIHRFSSRCSWKWIILIFFLGVLTAAITVWQIMQHSNPPRPCNQLNRGSSASVAKNIIKNLNESHDPCDDFYEFACGGFIENSLKPHTVFDIMGLDIIVAIRGALDKVIISSDPRDAYVKARMHYDSCLDTQAIDKLGKEPLLDVIKELGGWHLLPDTAGKRDKWDLQQLLQNVQIKYNAVGLFTWEVKVDDKNSSQHAIAIDQINDLEPRNLDRMINTCVNLGAERFAATADMKMVLEFETALANITMSHEKRRDKDLLYNPYTIKKWQEKISFLNWTMYFNQAFQLVNHQIFDNETIIVYTVEYFKKLDALIKNYSRTEEGRRTLTSFIMLRVSESSSKHLYHSFRDEPQLIWKPQSAFRETKQTREKCVSETAQIFAFAVGAMYVEEVFHSDAKSEAETMTENIRNAFKDNLKNLAWMDAETREAAEKKVDAIKVMIAYPDYILNKDELNKQYQELEVKPNEYFKNNIAFNLFSLKNNLNLLGKPVDKNNWPSNHGPTELNAFYNPHMNRIVITAGILQSPIFSSENPLSVNYGAIGAVIAHEVAHGFDDQGRKYDSSGNLKQWWNNLTINQFMECAECIKDQFSGYTMDGLQLNGKLTLGENFADIVGLKAANLAYLENREDAKESLTLPDLPQYDDLQLLFISFAQAFCSSMKKETNEHLIKTDTHSISKYRVNGALQNMEEFSEVFKCPVGSYMNPKEKCKVW